MPRTHESTTHPTPPDGAISEAVIAAVATFTSREPTDLPPLFEAVDPDALNRLFTHPYDAGRRFTVNFNYAGCAIQIARDGQITVSDNS